MFANSKVETVPPWDSQFDLGCDSFYQWPRFCWGIWRYSYFAEYSGSMCARHVLPRCWQAGRCFPRCFQFGRPRVAMSVGCILSWTGSQQLYLVSSRYVLAYGSTDGVPSVPSRLYLPRGGLGCTALVPCWICVRSNWSRKS